LTREVLCGDSAEVLKRLADDTCSLCLCDPPYGLSFMGSSWDAEVPGVAIWREVLRVLKPGASCFVCSGARQDTLLGNLLALKQAGFEIQHSALTWVFANGAMPKSTNLSKDADKAAFNAWVKALIADGSLTLQAKCQLEAEHAAMSKRGETCPVCEVRLAALASGGDNLVTRGDLRKAASAAVNGEGDCLNQYRGNCVRSASRQTLAGWAEPGLDGLHQGQALLSALITRFGPAPGVREKVGELDRNDRRLYSGVGDQLGHAQPTYAARGREQVTLNLTSPSTPEAQALEGLRGGAVPLKPMSETVLWVTKPMDRKPIRENVLTHGTGVVNIDGCRIPFEGEDDRDGARTVHGLCEQKTYCDSNFGRKAPSSFEPASGRYPSNLLITARALGDFSKYCDLEAWAEAHDLPPSWLDAAEEGILRVAKPSRAEKNAGCDGLATIEIVMVECMHHGNHTRGASWDNADLQVALLVDTEQSPPKVIGVSGTGPLNASEWSMLLSGNGIMDLFPTDIAFTTPTGTHSTTELRIFNWLTGLLTNASTAAASCEKTGGGNHAESAGKPSLSVSFTNAKPAFTHTAKPVLSGSQWRISVAGKQPQASHPTVKPALLMEYLIALACPEGGLVLDPFLGSGTTGVAAVRLNRPFIGIDLSEEYCEIARVRIAHAEAEREDTSDAQPTLELEAADV